MGGERWQVVNALSFYDFGPQVELYALLLLTVMEQHFSPWIEHLINVFPTRLYLMYLPMLDEEKLQVASPRVNEKQQSDTSQVTDMFQPLCCDRLIDLPHFLTWLNQLTPAPSVYLD